jgi:hypothetical protein
LLLDFLPRTGRSFAIEKVLLGLQQVLYFHWREGKSFWFLYRPVILLQAIQKGQQYFFFLLVMKIKD